MSAEVLRAKLQAAAPSNAEGALRQKRRNGEVVSGGRVVAKALEIEGVGTVFTLC